MRIQIDNLAFHYDLSGDGEPVLFIHGFPLSGEMWQPTVQRLSGWRCIVPDLRGFGRSAPSDTVTIERFSDDLATLLREAGEPRPVVVCGLSMGGVIALDFFRRYRAHTRALVLVDCRPDAEDAAGRGRREQVAANVMHQGSGVLAEEMIQRLVAPGASWELRKKWTDLMASSAPIAVAAASRALAYRADSTPMLGQIDVPTLLVFGERDEITPPEIGITMQAAIPGSRLAVIPDAGHLPPVEQPDRFADTLRSFLGRDVAT
jgi:pimeloyl-ACP methyl ester carboxylesterase